MGVPKFYRWISERYPCLSQVVKEFQIPDFDNLYLDMNGIIHTCSHPNDDDPHFRISEEKIFANICHYIEFLFKMIKPRRVFFMAVDGVAPRAKMNQQRGRRFRTAKAAITLEEQAKNMGQELPAEARFDSNCITPGTEFMDRLHACLKGFVTYKVSTDKLWKGIRVYLSGHDAPGEGEHKIMEFIRYEKSQPGYNPNTRHCLYGLDADLIMLGLCSHEPFFSLLREEVKFGKRSQKRLMTPEETTFHLLHISLLRDYLGHEFSPVKIKITFDFDVESIIDDFVLMSFLVGNDFIPHLPQLHIHHDALPVLFRTYIEVLPSLNGYINEQGILNLGRFEMFLKKLAEYDFKRFEEMNDDFQYSDCKSKSEEKSSNCLAELGFSSLAISKMAEFDSSDSDDDFDQMQLEFYMHKTDYYVNKLEFDNVSEEMLKEQAEGYVRAIQWNLHYYYHGVVSWSWYYPHHYSPYISDIKDFKDMEMNFELGEPFLPFQQLLAVLPKLSKNLLPLSYQELMCNEDSPLADYYPDDFMTDLNGKQQEWEAIVLIPFINEKLLLKFSAFADEKLTPEEKQRNRHGPHLLYTYSLKSSGPLPSFLRGCYPDLSHSYYKCELIDQNSFRLPASRIRKGLCEGVALDKVVLGFPTLRSIEHTAELRSERVKVFQMVSQKENMMLTIKEIEPKNLESLAEEIVGKVIYAGWPHLQEVLVVELSDGNRKIVNGLVEEMTANEKDIWKKQVEGLKELNYERWGIFLGSVQVVVQVKTLVGIKTAFSKDGQLVEEKQWSKRTCNFALQSTLWKVDVLQLCSPNPPECFPPDGVVFILVPPYYGEKGTVIKADLEKRTVLVNVSLPPEPNLHSIVAHQDKFTTEEYKPGYIASQQLGIDSYYLSRLTGTFLVQTSPKGSSSPNRVNIGLNLKFSRKNEEVRGFTKKMDNTWFYSEKAIRLLDTFLKQFPNFFEKLLRFANEDIVYLEDLYPNGEGSQIINKVTEWLKSQAMGSVERQTCGMDKLDAGVITEIEKKVSQLNSKGEIHQTITKEFQPHQLCNPYLCKGIISSSCNNFKLFDRVVNISPASSVPVGLRGTISGIGPEIEESERIYEIVFDKPFFGGLSLSCSPGKGYRLPGYSLLKLSSQSKTVKNRANQNPQLSIFDSAIKQLRDNPPLAHQNVKPFYNTGEMFNPQYVNRMPLNESHCKQFVTPKADYLSPPLKRDYQQNVWAALKKGNSESRSSSYGQKVSVEELFSSAANQKMYSNENFIEILNGMCFRKFKSNPAYNYHNHGQINYHIATVNLPNGLRITSAPCQSKQAAAMDAAEKAITQLRASEGLMPVPLLVGTPPPMFLPPQVSIMRHPSPAYYQAADSFMAPSHSPPVSMRRVDSDLFHMPGGGTARVKDTRGGRPAKMIIPAQVLKQVAKSPFDSSGSSNSDWPDLPPRTAVVPELSKSAPPSNPNESKRKPKRRIAANFQNS